MLKFCPVTLFKEQIFAKEKVGTFKNIPFKNGIFKIN